MPLQVIGAGFGRTGTSSLKEALEVLGFPCYHRDIAEEHPDDALWLALSKGKSIDFESVFQNHTAAIDWPVAKFYQEIFRKYPNAKVILTVRDPDMWYQSISETIFSEVVGLLEQRKQSHKKNKWLRKLNHWVSPTKDLHAKMVESVIVDGQFHGKFLDKEDAIQTYNEHIEEVKQFVHAGQLLVYNVKEGWGPLCAFLGVPVPSTSFPLLEPLGDEGTSKPLARKSDGFEKFIKATTIVSAVAGLGLFLFRHHGAIFKALKF